MGSAILSGSDAGYEHSSLPDDRYRSALIALLAAQAGPVWSVGQQQPYATLVMDGPGLEHWVRMSGVWAEVERNVWELTCLLQHVGVERLGDLISADDGAATLVTEAIETWIDLLFCEVVLGKLGTAMVQACQRSSYAPLARSARLLVFGKAGTLASGVLGLREAATGQQVPGPSLREAGARWIGVGTALAERIESQQHFGGWVDLGIAERIDPLAVVTEAELTIGELVGRAP